jgi:hypothetical protein
MKIVKRNDVNSRFLESTGGVRDMTACNQSVVRHKQRSAETKLARSFADSFKRAVAKDHARVVLKIKSVHSLDRIFRINRLDRE